MTARRALSRKARVLQERLGLSYDRLLGFRFAINVFMATTIVWFTLRLVGDTNPVWAIASMVATSDPQPDEARRIFRSRLVNVLVGCVTGFSFLLLGSSSDWLIPVALAVTVLISTNVIRVKTMWREAPITAAIVIAAAISGQSGRVGFDRGLHKVAEVLFGSIVGLLVSLLMSKVWLIQPPARGAGLTPASVPSPPPST